MVVDFPQRKNSILFKQDKSLKGHWDEKIQRLCEKINSLENYYTTSSCSGRVVLMIDSEKKEKDLFLKVYHDLISFEELREDLNIIINPAHLPKLSRLPTRINKSLLMKNSQDSYKNKSSMITTELMCERSEPIMSEHSERDYLINFKQKRDKKSLINSNFIKFKSEPCILHVACADLESARKLYDKAKLAGWKKSGIIASGKRFVVELNSTEKLEFPIMAKGKILVSDEFLKLIVKKTNENLKKSWAKIERLKESI